MNKENYNINRNPKRLSSEQIHQHKDFNALMKQFNQAPKAEIKAETTSKFRWLYPTMAAAAAILGGIFFFNNLEAPKQDISAEGKAYFASQPYINPPIKSIKPKYKTKTIDAQKGGVYIYENGSKLTVPANAFVKHQGGGIVEGEVQINYREFHDYVDFFVSGIPMAYDSLGVEYQLESAGMIEVYAEQNGQKLVLQPGKELKVELTHDIYTTANDDMDFNIYYLDTLKRNWVYQGKNNLTVLDEKQDRFDFTPDQEAEQNYQDQLALIDEDAEDKMDDIEASIPRAKAPLKPSKPSSTAHVFNLEFKEDLFELDGSNSIDEERQKRRELQKQYKDMLWQVMPNQANFNEDAASKIEWQDMKLKQLNDRDFELTLIAPNSQMKVIVNPVLTGKNYTKALNKFNQSYADYEKKMAERESQLAAKKQALKEEIADRKRLAKMALDKRIETLKAEGKTNKAIEETIRHKVVNTFHVSKLGIWNCDRPLPPWMQIVKANFELPKDQNIDYQVAFLADKTKNTVAQFYANNGTEVRFDKRSKKLLWLVTKDNKLAVYQPQNFDKISEEKQKHTFVLNVIDKPIETEEDIREILNF